MGGNSKFFDGFLWGLLIGGTAVFLFGTKRGNKVLKIITEEGTQGLNKILEEVDEAVESETPEEIVKEENDEKVSDFSDNHFEDIQKISKKPKVKRFFKSSRK